MADKFARAKELRCTVCRVVRPAHVFALSPRTGWRTKECHACEEARLALWATVAAGPPLVRPASVLGTSSEYLCLRCGRTLPVGLFGTWTQARTRTTFVRPGCRACANALQRARLRAVGLDPGRRRRERNRQLARYGLTVDG
jgi:hypothetical protein